MSGPTSNAPSDPGHLADAGAVSASVWETFQPFGVVHLIASGVCVLVMVAFALAGRRLRGTPAGVRLTRWTAYLALAYWLLSNSWWLIFREFELGRTLPLHVCDVAGLVAVAALLTGQRLVRTVLYFWGFALSTQAFVTPIIREGLGQPEFWLFWISHVLIVGPALYDVVALGYRPRARDIVIAFLLTAAYAAAVLPFNLWFGTNYGYIADSVADNPTVIHALGPWPFRLLPLAGLVLSAFVVVWLPWAIASLVAQRRAGKDASASRG